MDKKILIISHNILSPKTNIGRTLLTQFSDFPKGTIAQIYFSSETPTKESLEDVKFFQLSDRDALKSFVNRKDFGNIKQASSKTNNKGNNKLKQFLVNYLRHQSQLIYIIRDFIWKHSKWHGYKLFEFLNDFKPDVVYFASGDYAFSYLIALTIAKKYNIPLVIGCYDDFYLYRKKTINPLAFFYHKHFMKIVKKSFDYASCFTALCETMVDEYKLLFNKPGYVIFNSFTQGIEGLDTKKNDNNSGIMVYAGNLGLGRGDVLIKLARIIKKHPECGIKSIDIFSGSVGNITLRKIKRERNINFKGFADYTKIQEILSLTPYVLHVESFIKKNIGRVKYSMSTKIADVLNCGNLLIAVGPENISSIDYIKKNNAGICLTSYENIEKDLISALTKKSDLNLIQNAKKLALKNHVSSINSKKLLMLLKNIGSIK